MTLKCFKCSGIIPDISFNSINLIDRNDCKNHIKEPKSMTKEEILDYLAEYSKYRND